MPKAYKVLVKVHSAEIKYEKDQPAVQEPRCRVEYDAFVFETRQRADGDQKQPTWQDEFELTYFAKAPLVFRLLALDPVSKTHKELCRGELDLEKKKGSTGEMEVSLKTEAKKDKSAGLLRVSLTWLGDFELTPFRLELVAHTAEVLRRKELGQCRVRAQLGHAQVKLTDRDAQETPAVAAGKGGQFIWKHRLQWLVTTQDELRVELLGQQKVPGQGASVVIRLGQLLQMKTGVVKKLWLYDPLPPAPEKPEKTDKKEDKKEEKRERRGAIWVMVNHNYKPALDPKLSGLAVAERPERSMSPAQAKVAGTPLTKQGMRKWLYEEFKPQHKHKISLAAMTDLQKEAYLAVQVAALGKLKTHRETLRDHLEQLEDKMDETLAKMREKKQAEEKVSPEEKQRKHEMDEKFKEIRKLQVEAEKLKEEFTGGSGFDKLKELENTKGMRTKHIAELKQEVDKLEKNNEKREQRLLEIEEKNKEEVSSGDQNRRLTEELHKARDQLKLLEREMDKRAEVSKSVNAASLQLEKEYRELCRKHKINDVLMVRESEQGDYHFRDFDPTRAKTPTKKAADKRLLNPIWRGIQEDKKLEIERMTAEEKEIAEREKDIASMTHSPQQCEKLLQLWRDALASKESAKAEAKKEEREVGDKKKEIARLETSINDRKNVDWSDAADPRAEPEDARPEEGPGAGAPGRRAQAAAAVQGRRRRVGLQVPVDPPERLPRVPAQTRVRHGRRDRPRKAPRPRPARRRQARRLLRRGTCPQRR